MKTISQLLAWFTLFSFVSALLWSLLLGCDLIRRSKIPTRQSMFAAISLFGISAITLGTFPLLDEAMRLQRGEERAVDGQMYCVQFIVAGLLTLLVVGIAWLATLTRHRSSHQFNL